MMVCLTLVTICDTTALLFRGDMKTLVARSMLTVAFGKFTNLGDMVWIPEIRFKYSRHISQDNGAIVYIFGIYHLNVFFST